MRFIVSHPKKKRERERRPTRKYSHQIIIAFIIAIIAVPFSLGFKRLIMVLATFFSSSSFVWKGFVWDWIVKKGSAIVGGKGKGREGKGKGKIRRSPNHSMLKAAFLSHPRENFPFMQFITVSCQDVSIFHILI